MRLVLRPGLQVLRRDVRTLQLGLEWPGVATLPDSPAVRAVLDAVDGCRTVDEVVAAAVSPAPGRHDADITDVLHQMLACGVVVDQAKTTRDQVSEAGWAALWLLAGPGGEPAELLRRRRTTQAHVRGVGQVAGAVRHALTRSEVLSTQRLADADVVMIASDSEPDRDVGDVAMHRSVPHLWVWVRELVGVVGPFVTPGSSACLRCIDEARTDIDTAWPALVASTLAHPSPVPACAPVLATLVATFAAHELEVFASGLVPQTWGRMVEIPHGFGIVGHQRYEAHPRCGCGWGQRHDTMGA